MAKFHGTIGYVHSEQTAPGIWTDVVTEREYYGEILRDSKQWMETKNLNDDLTISNRISIVSDDFATLNIGAMRYIKWAGVSWKVSSVQNERPRLILSLGGVYNGPTSPPPTP